MRAQSTFSERLVWMLDGRKKSPWGKALGIASGTLDTMTKGDGNPPTADTLTRIMRSENVCLGWLLTGDGAPFIRNPVSSDRDGAQLITALLAEEPWQILLAEDGQRISVALHQQIHVQPGVEGKIPYRYRAMELITGPLGIETLSSINKHVDTAQLHIVHVSGLLMDQIMRGEWGTYRVFGDDKTPGIASNATRLPFSADEAHRQIILNDLVLRNVEPVSLYNSELSEVIRGWMTLSKHERMALKLVLGPLIEKARNR